MKITKINPENWVDREVEIVLHDDEVTFEMYDETFRIAPITICSEAGFDMEMSSVLNIEANGKVRKIAPIFRCKKFSNEFECSASDILRSDVDPRMAAAKLISNIW